MSDLGFRASRRSTQVMHSGHPTLCLRPGRPSRALEGSPAVPPLCRPHLEASNLSPGTIRAYPDDGALLAAFLDATVCQQLS